MSKLKLTREKDTMRFNMLNIYREMWVHFPCGVYQTVALDYNTLK